MDSHNHRAAAEETNALNDPARLAALDEYALLDTPAEEAFDRLTRLAVKLLKAPISLVSLVEPDRQFFKSCIGLPEPWASLRETPLSHSFCQHVVADSQPLVIEDARRDPRLCDNAAIQELGVVAYLGMPLITSEGACLGSLCVIDSQPRQWTSEEISALDDLSKSVISEIVLRSKILERKRAQQVEDRLHKAEDLFRTFMDNSPALAWMKDVEGHYIFLNQPFERLFNINLSDWIGKTDSNLWPESIAKGLRENDLEVLKTKAPLTTVELVPHADGLHSWMVHKFLVTGHLGETLIAGTGTDITEYQRSQQAQARFVAILEATTDCVIMTDSQGLVTYVNSAGRKLLGVSLEESVRDKPIFAYLPTWAASVMAKQGIPTAMREGVWAGDTALLGSDGREVAVSQVILAHRNTKGEVEFLSTVMRDITAIKQAEENLHESNERLATQVHELEQRNHEIEMLSEMSELLQTCQTIEEAHTVISQMVGRLFGQTGGVLYLRKASSDFLEAVAEWGGSSPDNNYFLPHDCWALRRGRIHIVRDTKTDLVCQHLNQPLPSSYLCVPMVAQGKAIGLLHLRQAPGEAQQRLAQTFADQIALAVANLILRETLRSQSIRDPLTGLYNRRYMEESLVREISRAQRNHQPLGVIMIDIDHFKKFNDTYGHDAGDAILRAMGALLKSQIRGGDIACRYGGEELTLILPDVSLEAVQQRAEKVRAATAEMTALHRDGDLGPITVSLGVAIYPEHGGTGEDVLRAADAALYRAKRAGRNRVVVAEANGNK